jgi:peptidoglycan/LPS O-acetylase OafA/YrhL
MDRPRGAGGLPAGRRAELDGLRGLAVLAVAAHHSGLRRFFPGGFLGVDVFFVLSGFLITVLLLREHAGGGVSLRRFYLRRARRLLPALAVLLAFCCAWAAFRVRPNRAHAIYRAVLLTAAHAANGAWACSAPLDLLGHAWSLSVEEQFYLAWPPLLVLLLRRRVGPRAIGLLAAAGVVASAACRAAVWCAPGPAAAQAAAVSLVCRADALLLGCLAALAASCGRLPRTGGRVVAWASAGLLVLGGALCREGDAWLYLGGFTLVAAAAAVVVTALACAPTPLASAVLGWRPLAWLGRVSYGLYLWHFPLLSAAPKLLHGVLPCTHRLAWLNGPLSFAAALLAATLSYYALERRKG